MLPSPDLTHGRRDLSAQLVVARRQGTERSDWFRETRCRTSGREPAWSTFTRGERRTAAIPGSGQALLLIRQRPEPDHVHPWSAADVLRILSFFPPPWLRNLRFLIFRRPTRREWPVDASYFPAAQIGGECGEAIAINAVASVHEERGLSDLDRSVARRCGARRGRRRRDIRFDAAASRAFMLYHVLLHEVGHLVDTVTTHDREEYAESFALEWERRLRIAGLIPFAAIPDPRPPRTRRHGWSERVERRVRDHAVT